jgi:hypothetical protein
LQLLAVACSGLQWFAVVCSGLQWFAVVCSGLQWFAVVCSGLQWYVWWTHLCLFFLLCFCFRPLYNIDSSGGSQQGGGVGDGMERESRIESPKRRTRNEPHVASPSWKTTHVTEARKIRPAPHQRFSMSLRWLMKKQQTKDPPPKKKKAIVDPPKTAPSSCTTAAINVPPKTTLITTPTKQKEANTVDASNNTKGTTKVNKTKHKKKKKKTPKKQEFDLDSELASLKQEFAKGI